VWNGIYPFYVLWSSGLPGLGSFVRVERELFKTLFAVSCSPDPGREEPFWYQSDAAGAAALCTEPARQRAVDVQVQCL